jgi:hypothetical protein
LCRQLSLPDALLDTVVSMIFDKADMDGDGEISIDEITTVLAGKKWHILCAILYSKCIILPRQARDKHRGNSKRDAFSYSVLNRCEQYGHGRGANLRHIRRHARGAVRGQKTGSFSHFSTFSQTKKERFTKTGRDRHRESSKRERRFSRRRSTRMATARSVIRSSRPSC